MRTTLIVFLLVFSELPTIASNPSRRINEENTKSIISLILGLPEMIQLMNYESSGTQADIRIYDRSNNFAETDCFINIPSTTDRSVLAYVLKWKKVDYSLNGSFYRDVVIDSFTRINKKTHRLVVFVRPFRLDLRDSSYTILALEVIEEHGKFTVKLVEAMSSE
jgi:hypothetical protein